MRDFDHRLKNPLPKSLQDRRFVRFDFRDGIAKKQAEENKAEHLIMGKRIQYVGGDDLHQYFDDGGTLIFTDLICQMGDSGLALIWNDLIMACSRIDQIDAEKSDQDSQQTGSDIK